MISCPGLSLLGKNFPSVHQNLPDPWYPADGRANRSQATLIIYNDDPPIQIQASTWHGLCLIGLNDVTDDYDGFYNSFLKICDRSAER